MTHGADANKLSDAVASEIERGRLPLPVCDPRLQDLTAAIESDDTNASLLVKLVRSVPQAELKVVQLASIPAYSRRAEKPTNLHEAILCLGLELVGDLTRALLVRELLPPVEGPFRTHSWFLWRHFTSSATIARITAWNTLCMPVRGVFFPVLFRDVGEWLILALADRLASQSQGNFESMEIAQAIAMNRGVASQALCGEWAFDADMESLVTGDFEPDEFAPGNQYTRDVQLAALASMSGHLADTLFGTFLLPDEKAPSIETCLNVLSISDQELKDVLSSFLIQGLGFQNLLVDDDDTIMELNTQSLPSLSDLTDASNPKRIRGYP